MHAVGKLGRIIPENQKSLFCLDRPQNFTLRENLSYSVTEKLNRRNVMPLFEATPRLNFSWLKLSVADSFLGCLN